MQADYVVVGGGSAGAVLARRLSEDDDVSVALVEAGHAGRSLMVQLPVGFAKMLTKDKFDWNYVQEPDPSLGGRRFLWSAGRMLGGGSSINGQVFIRGTRADFDRWVTQGAPGWGFDNVWPYFLRSEHWHGPPSQAHGTTGELSVSPMRDPHPLCATFIAACAEYGLPIRDEYNAGEMEGAFLTQTNQRDGWRCSTEKAFLRDLKGRGNLEILTDAEVTRVLFAEGRAVGVEMRRGGKLEQVRARREVILCAGTIGTPALLMRSGIGPAAHLRDRGIEVVRDAPDVGRNLQEHPGIAQHRYVNQPTMNSEMGPLGLARSLWQYATRRMGPLSAPAVQAMAFTRTSADLPEPDIQLHFLPLVYDVEPDTLSGALAKMAPEPAVYVSASLCRPKSRGRVELAGDGSPLIRHQVLGDPDDVRTGVAAMKVIDRLFDTAAFRTVVTGRRQPPERPANDDEWVAYIRAKTIIIYHPVGTCRMGSDAASVVDPALRVRGIDGLRIADASIMPSITSGNTNAPSIMIGEHGAEIIRASARHEASRKTKGRAAHLIGGGPEAIS